MNNKKRKRINETSNKNKMNNKLKKNKTTNNKNEIQERLKLILLEKLIEKIK